MKFAMIGIMTAIVTATMMMTIGVNGADAEGHALAGARITTATNVSLTAIASAVGKRE